MLPPSVQRLTSNMLDKVVNQRCTFNAYADEVMKYAPSVGESLSVSDASHDPVTAYPAAVRGRESYPQQKSERFDGECYHCGRYGHKATDCFEKRREMNARDNQGGRGGREGRGGRGGRGSGRGGSRGRGKGHARGGKSEAFAHFAAFPAAVEPGPANTLMEMADAVAKEGKAI
jgi:hypothetical protein